MLTGSYYNILGVKPTATQAEIKKAYRRLAKKYHPDISKEQDAEACFKQVAIAYDVLKKTKSRVKYDLFGANDQHQQPASDFNGVDLDMFADLFNQTPRHRKKTTSKPPKSSQKPSPKPSRQEVILSIELEDVFHGGSKELRLDKGKTVCIDIPKGVVENQVISLPGQATNGGELLVSIKLNPHPLFTYKGKDLFASLTLPASQLKPSASVLLPSLSEAIEVTIPDGCQQCITFQFKGLGLPGNPAGDLTVTCLSEPETPASVEQSQTSSLSDEAFDFILTELDIALKILKEGC